MKTMNRVVPASQNAGHTLLTWSGKGVASRLGEALSQPTTVRRVKVPVLRIVPSAVQKEDLFKYATGAKARRWETIVFAALAVSAVGAVALAFFGI